VAGVRCNECGQETPEGAERCPGCGAPVPVLFGGGESLPADNEATVVTAAVPRGGGEAGEVIAERYESLGEPRPDLWGAYLRARDIIEQREVTLYRVERSIFRTRDDIECFRSAQVDLVDRPDPILAAPERIIEISGQFYLAFREPLLGTLRDPEPAAPFRGADPDHVRRMLRFAADYLAAAARLAPRGLHLGLRASCLFTLGRELRVAQLGFCSAFPADLVARRLAHDSEGKFYAAPEVLQQGRGSGRADIYSLGLLIGFAISGRERQPQLKGFAAHPALHDVLSRMISEDEVGRPADLAGLAGDLAELATLDVPVAAPQHPVGAGGRESTQEVAEADIESLEEVGEPRETTGEISVGEIVPVEPSAVGRREVTAEIAVDDIQPVEPSGIRRPFPSTAGAGKAAAAELQTLDDTDAEGRASSLPGLGEDSWGTSGAPKPVPAASPTPRPAAIAGRKDLGPGAVKPEESDGAIDPRLLRAAVRSDAEKGIAAKAKAVDLLRRDAAKGDVRAKQLLTDPSTRLPMRPSTAPPPPSAPPAAARISSRPPAAQTLLGMAAPAMSPMAPVKPPTLLPPTSPSIPPVARPTRPVMAPVVAGVSAPVPMPSHPTMQGYAPLQGPPPAPPAPVAQPLPPGYPQGSWPPQYPGGPSAPPPAAPMPMAPMPRTTPAPAPVMSGTPVGWPPGFASPPQRASVQPAAPAPVLAAPRLTPHPAPVRPDIPSSVVGPDLVVMKGAMAHREEPTDESSVATSEAQVAGPGSMPVVVRKVVRPSEEIDLPPTEAWTPKREAEAPPPMRQPGPQEHPPLFDDSYKLFHASELDGQLLPPVPAEPDRSMDLIWWSLAIAGALVLVALLITFR
jgi:hypothetical protein